MKSAGMIKSNILSYHKNKKAHIYILILVILFYGSSVRFLGIKFGLPYLHNYDEPRSASNALRILKTGDFNPHFFNYPGFSIYSNLIVDIFNYYYLLGKDDSSLEHLRTVDEIKIDVDTGWRWSISHPSFYYWDRALTALLGSLSLLIVFLIGKEIKNEWVGLLSAGFLAGFSWHIQHSRYATPDLPVSFWLILVLLFSLKFYKSKRLSHFSLALLFAGISFGTKYNAFISVFIVIVAYTFVLIEGNKARYYIRYFPLIVIIPALGFLIWNPYCILDFSTFLKHSGYEVLHYKILGHLGAESIPGWNHFYFQMGRFKSNIPVLLFYFAFIGVLVSFKEWKKAIIVMIFPFLYMWYMSQQKVNFHRNFVVMYNFFSIYSALAVYYFVICFKKLSELLDKINLSKIRHNRSAVKLITLLPLIFLALYLFKHYQIQVKDAILTWKSMETRSQAINYTNLIKQKERIKKIAITEELRVHEIDLKRLQVKYDLINHKDILKVITQYDLIITGRNFKTFYSKGQKPVEDLNSITRVCKIKKSIGSNPAYLDILSVNPQVVILVGLDRNL